MSVNASSGVPFDDGNRFDWEKAQKQLRERMKAQSAILSLKK